MGGDTETGQLEVAEGGISLGIIEVYVEVAKGIVDPFRSQGR